MSKREIAAAEAEYRVAEAAMADADAHLDSLMDEAGESGDYCGADDYRNYGYADTAQQTLAAAQRLLGLLGYGTTNTEA